MQVEAPSGDKAGSQVQDRTASTKNSGSEVQVEASSGEKSGSQLQDWTTSTKNTGSEVQVEAPSGESMVIKAANGEVNMPSMHYGYNAMRKMPTVLLGISDPSIESITVLAISVVSCKERLSTPMNVIYIKNCLVNFFTGSVQEWSLFEWSQGRIWRGIRESSARWGVIYRELWEWSASWGAIWR